MNRPKRAALGRLHQIFPVAMRFGVTPVPIPNTTVKTKAAESTILATVWEDRWLPDLQKKKRLVKDLYRKWYVRPVVCHPAASLLIHEYLKVLM